MTEYNAEWFDKEADRILEQAFLDGASDSMWVGDRHVKIFATAKQAITTAKDKHVKWVIGEKYTEAELANSHIETKLRATAINRKIDVQRKRANLSESEEL